VTPSAAQPVTKREIKAPSGETITIEVGGVLVSATDYIWNHACYCLNCSRKQLAAILIYNHRNPQNPIKKPCAVYPDLNEEHIDCQIGGEMVTFSLYGPSVVTLRD